MTIELRNDITLTVVRAGEEVVADAVAVPVDSSGTVPGIPGVDAAALRRAGFLPRVGRALPLPTVRRPLPVAVGVDTLSDLNPARMRDAAAAFARSVPFDAALAAEVPAVGDPAAMAAAIVEGTVLARHEFSMRSIAPEQVPLTSLVLVAPPGAEDAVSAGARRGRATAGAAVLARDLATCPAGVLTASRFADIAEQVGAGASLEVEVFDLEAVRELGLGGLLGVNRGSVEEPRMIVLRYRPAEPTGHLALVGKGIMYDSGGISLKPGDISHSQMKNDMTGAGSILAAMGALEQLGVTSAVTGYLMCTDNMPSGSAMQLGDVLTMRGGRTVEVLNTDAEGRLVMADAIVLAVEDGADAIVDIATLTGQCLRTLGEDVAGLMSNSEDLAQQVTAAAVDADEPVWRLPLIERYREELDSDIADLKNIGGINAGSITAGLFLREFVDGVPWAHLDIAGTAQASSTRRWINRGPTGFGARLLIELALSFRVPPAG
ncbi:leucyl aminopeptidase family protein [Corynebacterium pacaense]|uniref:leucyl aminopeptidase family protein n=1 Tax=Corynebacterium pacaense TaxID=1816684 RepID=UPI0009BA3CEC|nr:leucyl aminopeptidase [Corynebacterium pacaense]